jgi:hypothetical protein
LASPTIRIATNAAAGTASRLIMMLPLRLLVWWTLTLSVLSLMKRDVVREWHRFVDNRQIAGRSMQVGPCAPGTMEHGAMARRSSVVMPALFADAAPV